jgi:D-arabinose 1-dehydrogenase-like Zn-dependent alcohol dehydrogenase
MISIVNPPSDEDSLLYGARKASVWAQPDSRELSKLAELFDSGKLRSFVETILPLEQARQAQELSQKGHVRGKIVLRVAPAAAAPRSAAAYETAAA